jgi:hypothetical protein
MTYTLYKITFRGNPDQTLSIGGRSLLPNVEYAFKFNELPLSLPTLKSLSCLRVEECVISEETVAKPAIIPIYKLKFNGGDKQSVSLGGTSLRSQVEYYFKITELPMPLKTLESIPNLIVEKTSLLDVPSPRTPKVNVGVVWKGMIPVNANKYGTFSKNQARWDLAPEVVQELIKTPGFEKLGG